VLILAHPLTDADVLPVAPLLVAAVAAVAVLVVALTARPVPRDARPADRTLPSEARDPRLVLVLRSVVGGLLALGVAAALWGPPEGPRNLGTILLGILGWPVLCGAAVALGPRWRALDAMDGAARLLRAPDGPAGGSVWLATVPAAALATGVGVLATSAAPAALGFAVAVYVVLTLAGCLALGRRWWLERVEAVGILLSWLGCVRRGRLATLAPPPGAAVLLGVAGGGLLFALVRRSEVWRPAIFALGPEVADIVGIAGGIGIGGLLLWLLSLLAARVGAPGAAEVAMIPVVGALVVTAALAGGRLLVAARALPSTLLDPLGRGWPTGGTPGGALPVGIRGVVLLQLAVLLAGAVVGATAGRRRAQATSRRDAGALLGIVAPVLAVVVGALAVLSV
jgi:hypothetical protein